MGSSALLLHGLAGHAGEWTETASWLSATNRVLAPDQRGQGKSQRRPADVSRQAFVDDAAMWIRELAGSSAIVVGQSLGGHTAFLLAAQYPELVKALVVAEASPAADPEAQSVVGDWLRSWPVPFPSQEAASAFFGGDSLWSRAWAGGLEVRPDGLWPSFDVDVMLACLDGVALSNWDEWTAIRCPTLIVRAEHGLPEGIASHMRDLLPGSRVVEVQGARHDLHLERPDQWREAVSRFLAEGA
ncbi:MAG: alpha/beta hydrolase [Candidatus Dormibacteraeota bacterium]|nr:alpha/beta hydrolase [Candidatus Dormibacteraeota bacterium]